MVKPAMHSAAKYGDLKTMSQLIGEGVSLDSRDDKGRTPLHVAAKWGQYNVVQLLISSKCDINALDHQDVGWSVGWLVNWLGFIAGFWHHSRYHQGCTPVWTAAFSERKDVTDLLLRHGAQVNRDDLRGVSLLHLASGNGWADTVQHILSLEEEVDVNATTVWGFTPLMQSMANSGDCAEILLRAGADPNQRCALDNFTALHFAASYGNTRVVQVLLGAEGLDLNPQDVNGQTPLHWACKEGYREVLKEMLEAGADYAIIDNDGETALSLGIREMSLTLEDIRLFVQQGLFFQEKEYMQIFENSILKESVLKDVNLCTQSVVNQFHLQSLPALKSISYFAEQLPNIDNFKLNAWEVDEVDELVRCEIGRSNFCNVLKVHPMSLKALCILTLITS